MSLSCGDVGREVEGSGELEATRILAMAFQSSRSGAYEATSSKNEE
jgi:hypothetical protein